MATLPTQIRLAASDKAKIETIRSRFGLPSASAAIRFSIETVYRKWLEPPIPFTDEQFKRMGQNYLDSTES
jgi:hypothetical protein